jgi:anti-anti-sigma regulatory factor
MMLRIETLSDGSIATIRLIGRIQAELLEELRARITGTGVPVVLDLDEVSLVDLDAVRFLGECQDEGISLVHCSPYITEWIARERGRSSRDSES